jgi:hypothetical protein
MVAIAAATAASKATMKNAARFAACGEGWVIPMVLMKAFEMSKRSFMSLQRRQFQDSRELWFEEISGVNPWVLARIYCH